METQDVLSSSRLYMLLYWYHQPTVHDQQSNELSLIYCRMREML